MPRIAIGLEYEGVGFCGWQTQPSGCGIQDVVERALGEIAGETIATVCAGRTDAGVHALAQTAHFDTSAQRPDSAWVRGANSLLPSSVAVLWAKPVADEFNARYSATQRHYRYLLFNDPIRPALQRGHVGWFHAPLDLDAMTSAAECLPGKHDFSAFRAAECQATSPIRVLTQLEIRRNGKLYIFDFRANGFLHHMVRNIVGCLVQIGKGAREPPWMKQVLEERDRTRAAQTFDAAGLYLAHVSYDACWGLPAAANRAWFENQGIDPR